MYCEADLVRIAKRENNSKRSYVVVNRLQGKHIPVKPGQALSMFWALAEILKNTYRNEKLLLIGFAETATAIGAAVAVAVDAYYLQTTRENLEGVNYLYFCEEHSHATEQKLVKDDLDRIVPQIDRIVFVEDEVTTGKTILNIVAILEKEYPGQASYAAASILNGMDQKALEAYRLRQIELQYLVKTDHASYEKAVQQYRREGAYIICTKGLDTAKLHTEQNEETDMRDAAKLYTEQIEESFMKEQQNLGLSAGQNARNTAGTHSTPLALAEKTHPDRKVVTAAYMEIKGWMDARRLVSAVSYEQACMQLWRDIDSRLHDVLLDRVLVLGTEEFMYPALLTAGQIAQNAREVWFHATTRSPIAVFNDCSYPLHVRYELCSLYDKNRRTFIYDIGSYDTVLIITDAHNEQREGIASLIQAAADKNKRIYVIRWC